MIWVNVLKLPDVLAFVGETIGATIVNGTTDVDRAANDCKAKCKPPLDEAESVHI